MRSVFELQSKGSFSELTDKGLESTLIPYENNPQLFTGLPRQTYTSYKTTYKLHCQKQFG